MSVNGLSPPSGARSRSVPTGTSAAALITVLRLIPDAVATAVLPPRPNRQMDSFRCAGTVLGVHGAALANLIWGGSTNTTVIELFQPSYIHAHFAWLCREFGHNYGAVLGQDRDGRLCVPPERFERLLDSLP